MASPDGLGTELESFRQQWLSDLRSRHDAHGPPGAAVPTASPSDSHPNLSPTRRRQASPGPPLPASARRALLVDDDDEYLQARSFDELPPASAHASEGPPADTQAYGPAEPPKKLTSALDHYEEAMEKEAMGNMGDSLKLYRKAYRMDNRVDRRYREKHYPGGVSAPASAPMETSSHAAGQTHIGSSSEVVHPHSMEELLARFAGLKIEPAGPDMDGLPKPPCPIATVPDEIIVHVLEDVAIDDVGDFVRLALVCRHFAYLVATEQRIWKRIALGEEFGFQGMHYQWQKSIDWSALDEEDERDVFLGIVLGSVAQTTADARPRAAKSLVTRSLIPAAYPSWKQMFRSRPRLRFNGCYISTVNYIRTGQASTNQLTWNSPIHIVTYYRYLRFFRDGTAISLLTTSEPGDVVHNLTKDALNLHRDHAHAYLPSAMMQMALKGRWRLSSALDKPDAPLGEQEGDLFVETEGVGSKYMYRMDMSLRSAGKGAKNNKIVWRGFYSYNKLTDDWAEFGLKNDKPFFFSRVRSYSVGQ